MTTPTPAEHEALRLADDLDAMGRSKDMGRPAIQDIERRAAAMLRALAAPHAGAVPDGWKLVPVEPTPEMLSAGSHSVNMNYHAGTLESIARHSYRAMLAASPAPCAMVGLTHEEAVDVLRFGASSKAMADAITRAFCQKNKLPEVGNGD